MPFWEPDMSDLARFRMRIPHRAAAVLPSPVAEPRTDAPLRGILLYIPAMVLFSASDACSKLLGLTMASVEIGWIRYATFAVLMLIPVLRRGFGGMRTRQPVRQVVRGLGLVGSSIFFIAGLGHLPMAMAAAVGFCSPLFITALSVPLLGEQVGLRRWAAVVVGLIGVLIVVRPGGSGFQLAIIFPVLSSAAWAVGMITTRQMAGTDRTVTTLAWSAFTGAAVLTLLLPFGVRAPTSEELAVGILAGVVSTAAQWLVVLAYRHAAAVVLAPFSYTQMLWSSTFGFLLFSALPDLWTLVGAAVIIASGLYTLHRERLHGRKRLAA
jgi:drug/metabolite transporter (DMT)-like permease